jgi:lysophospholipase L1-like esterase
LDLIFERVLPQYRRLQAIVIMVGGNDVFHWLEDGAPQAVESVVSAAQVFASHPEQQFGWRPARWATLELARRLRRAWFRPVDVREGAGSWVPAARRMRAEAKEVRTRAPDPGPMLDPFEHHFRRLLQRAQAHADRVLVVRQPWFEKEYSAAEASCCWHGGLGKPWRQAVSVYYTLEVVNHLMGLMDARAAAVADNLGIEHVDLRRTLTPSLENYYDYVHYTPAGAAVVAGAVAAALVRLPVPAARHYPSARVEPSSNALAST